MGPFLPPLHAPVPLTLPKGVPDPSKGTGNSAKDRLCPHLVTTHGTQGSTETEGARGPCRLCPEGNPLPLGGGGGPGEWAGALLPPRRSLKRKPRPGGREVPVATAAPSRSQRGHFPAGPRSGHPALSDQTLP